MNPNSSHRLAQTLAIALAAALLPAGSLLAQAWTGAGSDNLWTDGTNWQGGVAPVNNGTAASVLQVRRG